jgi:hypothetical protein
MSTTKETTEKTTEHSDLPSAEDALMRADIDGILCAVTSDERPVKGAAALLDWRLHGVISRFIRSGRISGTKGELVFLPTEKLGQRKNVVLVGVGPSTEPLLPSENKALLEQARTQLLNLKLTRIAVSQSGFGALKPSDLAKTLSGIEVHWIK